MEKGKYIKKLFGPYLWGNLLAVSALTVLIALGVRYGLDYYTHHGQSTEVPNVKHKLFNDAKQILDDAGLNIEVTDTGYVKSLPPDVILEQTPGAGNIVKPGRTIFVTVNASHVPTMPLPDIIDNSSLREALAKLEGLGFKVAMPQFIPGEKDWVYGVLVNGKHVVMGDLISVEDSVVVQVGNGQRDINDEVQYVDHANFGYEDYKDDLEKLKQQPQTPVEPIDEPAGGDEPEESAPEATVEPIGRTPEPAAPATPTE
ncbi:MAG: PASTA domain-containing protein [Prevotella sp.]|nr:PASTA domain-containing protein [Prevotella sp.]